MSEATLWLEKSTRVVADNKDDGLDDFIKKSENPNWWRTIRDELNQKNIEITDEQLEIMKNISRGKFVNKQIDRKSVV